jgi:hypothetical protein
MTTRKLAKNHLTYPTRAALTLLAAISALNFSSAATLAWDGSNTSNSQAALATGIQPLQIGGTESVMLPGQPPARPTKQFSRIQAIWFFLMPAA